MGKKFSFKKWTVAHFSFLNSFYFFHLLRAVKVQQSMSCLPHSNRKHLFNNKDHISLATSIYYIFVVFWDSGSTSPCHGQIPFFSTKLFHRNLNKYIFLLNCLVQSSATVSAPGIALSSICLMGTCSPSKFWNTFWFLRMQTGTQAGLICPTMLVHIIATHNNYLPSSGKIQSALRPYIRTLLLFFTPAIP